LDCLICLIILNNTNYEANPEIIRRAHRVYAITAVDEPDTLDRTFPEGLFAGTQYAAQQMGMVVN
jgi:hypothetical protein